MAHITDLPNELFDEIRQHTEDKDILGLGLTCRTINSWATLALLQKHGVQGLPESCSVISCLPKAALSALAVAFSLHHLEKLYFSFTNTPENLPLEAQFLERVVDRLEYVRFVSLDFSRISYRRPGGAPLPKFIPPLIDTSVDFDKTTWGNDLGSLIDKCLYKSCTHLSVIGGKDMCHAYSRKTLSAQVTGATLSADSRRANATLPAVRRTEFRLLKSAVQRLLADMNASTFITGKGCFELRVLKGNKLMGPKSSSLTLATQRKPFGFVLHSEMMVLPPFYNRTISMLRLNADSICALSIKFEDLASSLWRRLLQTILLPKIMTFSLAAEKVNHYTRSYPADLADVTSFLSRHSSLTTLRFFQYDTPRCSPPPESDLLPNLSRLVMNPKLFIWLFQVPWAVFENMKTLTFSNSLKAYQNSETVLKLLDEALEVAVPFIDSLEGINTLGFQFVGDMWPGLSKWFQSHILFPTTSVITSLHGLPSLNIKGLKVSALFGPQNVKLFPQFLALFPDLRHLTLEFLDFTDYQQSEIDGYISSLKTQCSNLEITAK